MKPVVIDLSHHNTIPQDLSGAKAAGIVGIIHKITEGQTFIDSKAKARYRLAQDAGLLWGVYHFVRPPGGPGNMRAQVEFFLRESDKIDDRSPETLYALDYEDPDVSLDDVADFLEELEARVGPLPILYSGHVLKDKLGSKADERLLDFPLWLAQYGPQAKLPPGWDRYYLWQYTDQGSLPGISGAVDLNHYDGPVENLIRDWKQIVPEPLPPEPQPQEPVEIVITVKGPAKVTINQE